MQLYPFAVYLQTSWALHNYQHNIRGNHVCKNQDILKTAFNNDLDTSFYSTLNSFYGGLQCQSHLIYFCKTMKQDTDLQCNFYFSKILLSIKCIGMLQNFDISNILILEWKYVHWKNISRRKIQQLECPTWRTNLQQNVCLSRI